MLYWLLYQKLYPFFHPFRIFRYVTFRTVFASLTALLITLFIGPYVINKLREFQIGQYVREDGPKSHLKKSGTPTMGGVLIVIAILLPTLFWADLADPLVWIVVFATLAFGAVGFTDDYIKVVKRRSLGLTPRAKLFGQAMAAILVAAALILLQQFRMFSTALSVPFFKSWRPDLMLHWFDHMPYLALLAFLPFVAWGVFACACSGHPTPSTSPTASTASPSAAPSSRPVRSPSSLTSAATSSMQITSSYSACRLVQRVSPSSADPWLVRPSASSGTTPIRRKSSWAMSARSP